MNGLAFQTESNVCVGGFRIEIHPDEITVASAPSTHEFLGSLTKQTRVLVLGSIAAAACIVVATVFLNDWEDALLYGIVTAFIVVPSLLWAYLGGVKNLHCTRESLNVVQFARGKVINKWNFPKDEVKGIRFAPVWYSRYGGVFGVVFTANGQKVKTLQGLESPEAQTVLLQLDRLGYDVTHDVGMQMMVEMELERRNSLFHRRR